MVDSMKIVATDGYTLNPGDNPWSDVSKIGELVVFERTVPADVIERCRDSDIAIINN
jgi:glycerate dehydrogenase